MDFTEALQIGRMAAAEGARVVREQFGNNPNRRVKDGSLTLVTDTDLAAEEAILKVLSDNTPYGILSEESGMTGETAGPLWIIDPLDGTSNFARSVPMFAVSVALMHQNDVIAGIIAEPMQQREYYALKGEGAFCNGNRLPLHTPDNGLPVVFINHGHRDIDKKRAAMITQRLSERFNHRKFGTTALELCYVATGNFDAFICSGDEIWDFAAGIRIATEAGCTFTDWQGNMWDGKSSYILVSKPEFHNELLSVTRNLR